MLLYFTTNNMAFVIHNQRARDTYWRQFRRSGKPEFKSIVAQNMPDNINNVGKIDHFKNKMYIEASDERKQVLTFLVSIFWRDEVNTIYNSRRILRENHDVSLSISSKLFTACKKINELKYYNFKSNLCKMLRDIANNGRFTEEQIKQSIAKLIATFLEEDMFEL